jgi:O-acetyl-ADP-ribose deacetylase (regulator of RNase III)
MGNVRRRKIVIGRRIEPKSLTEIGRAYNQTMVFAVGHVAMEAQLGDISQANVDAVVNAANNHLWMGAGVAGALKRAGGVEIEREAVAKGPVEIGEAVVTTGGSLQAQYVIHAAVMGQDLRTDQSKIARATRNALIRARDLGVSSIAFPALGTGVGGFPPELAAETMISECVSFISSESLPSLKKILFVLFSDDLLDAFEKRLR